MKQILVTLTITYLSFYILFGYSQSDTVAFNPWCKTVKYFSSKLSTDSLTKRYYLDSTDFQKVKLLEKKTGFLASYHIHWANYWGEMPCCPYYSTTSIYKSYLKDDVKYWSVYFGCNDIILPKDSGQYYKYRGLLTPSILSKSFRKILTDQQTSFIELYKYYSYIKTSYPLSDKYNTDSYGHYKLLVDSLTHFLLSHPEEKPEMLWDMSLDSAYPIILHFNLLDSSPIDFSTRNELIRSINSPEIILHLLSFCGEFNCNLEFKNNSKLSYENNIFDTYWGCGLCNEETKRISTHDFLILRLEYLLQTQQPIYYVRPPNFPK